MTKDKIIAILRRSEGHVSGEDISRTLGISRTAVNSAVKALRGEGYDIRSSTNKGYLLTGPSDKLNLGELEALLPTGRADKIKCLDKVDSTNTFLKFLSHSGAPDGQVVVAGEQSAGRGRYGRGFSSPGEKGIYMSLLMRPDSLPSETSNITAWVAVAVSDAVEELYGVRPGIKWVNDLVMNGKKLCGILTEISVEGESGHVQHVIVGIGININNSVGDFPEELRDKATSLLEQTGHRVPRAKLICEVIKRLDILRSRWPDGKQHYLDAYRRDCISTGMEVCLIRGGTETRGYAEDIDEYFNFVIRYPDGRRESVSSGEVSVRGIYGYV
ncbi:MAG: biotin--[acetyl-CoA-carboxylase] ligase [Eubacteriales bacterium]